MYTKMIIFFRVNPFVTSDSSRLEISARNENFRCTNFYFTVIRNLFQFK